MLPEQIFSKLRQFQNNSDNHDFEITSLVYKILKYVQRVKENRWKYRNKRINMFCEPVPKPIIDRLIGEKVQLFESLV
jgi:hypothetical protein